MKLGSFQTVRAAWTFVVLWGLLGVQAVIVGAFRGDWFFFGIGVLWLALAAFWTWQALRLARRRGIGHGP